MAQISHADGTMEIVRGDPLTFNFTLSIEGVTTFDADDKVVVEIKQNLDDDVTLLTKEDIVTAEGVGVVYFDSTETIAIPAGNYFWNVALVRSSSEKTAIFNSWNKLFVSENYFVGV